MKFKRLFLLASSVLLLASCGNQPASSSSEQPPASSQSSEEAEEYTQVDWNPADAISDGIGISSALIDIAVDQVLQTKFSYSCGFSFTGVSVVGATVKVTNNGVATAEVTHDGVFSLYGNKPGETIISLYDSTGYLHYRSIARFRPAMERSELERFVFEEVDYYASNYSRGSYVTFLGKGSAMFSGADEGQSLASAIRFEYEYSSESATEYSYTITTWDSASSGSSLVCTELNIDRNGYMLHLMTRNGVVDFFTPVFSE